MHLKLKLRCFDPFVGLLVTTWRWWENKCAFWYFNYWVKRVNWHRYGAVLCPPSQFIFQIIYLFMVTITVYCEWEKGKNNNIRVGLSNVAKVQKRSSWYFVVSSLTQMHHLISIWMWTIFPFRIHVFICHLYVITINCSTCKKGKINIRS